MKLLFNRHFFILFGLHVVFGVLLLNSIGHTGLNVFSGIFIPLIVFVYYIYYATLLPIQETKLRDLLYVCMHSIILIIIWLYCLNLTVDTMNAILFNEIFWLICLVLNPINLFILYILEMFFRVNLETYKTILLFSSFIPTFVLWSVMKIKRKTQEEECGLNYQ